MASSYSSRIKLEKQGSGENANTWGDRLNTNMIDLVDAAVAGVTAVDVDGQGGSGGFKLDGGGVDREQGEQEQGHGAKLQLNSIRNAQRQGCRIQRRRVFRAWVARACTTRSTVPFSKAMFRASPPEVWFWNKAVKNVHKSTGSS